MSLAELYKFKTYLEHLMYHAMFDIHSKFYCHQKCKYDDAQANSVSCNIHCQCHFGDLLVFKYCTEKTPMSTQDM